MQDSRLGSQRTAARAFVLVAIAAVAVIATGAQISGCSKSSTTKPQGGGGLLYGALVTPKSPYDPFFTDAYLTLAVDQYQVGHIALSWGAIQKGDALFDWSSLDPHIQKAFPAGKKLSIAIEFIHGGEADVPAYRWPEFPGWEDPGLRRVLVSFLREMKSRFPNRDSLHTLGWLWLGEGPDRYAAAFPGDDSKMIAFYGVLADSARAIFPYARIGTIITPSLLGQTHGDALIRSLRDSLDVIGLSVLPEDEPALGSPRTAVETMAAQITTWADRPVAVLEAGYPTAAALGSDEAKQQEFAGILCQWLRGRPSTLELFCWSPLFDTNVALADSLAKRRFPAEADTAARADFARRIATMSLHRIDGTNKLGRGTWVESRP